MDNLERLKQMTGEKDERTLSDLLFSAKNAIIRRRYQCKGISVEQIYDMDVEEEYYDLQYRIALALYQKRGADFEESHSSNGISRQWGSEGIPMSLLSEVVPLCGVIR